MPGPFHTLDVICARRQALIYVSPPFCEVDFSSSGEPVIVLNPFRRRRGPTGLLVQRGAGLRFRWDSLPGAICYSLYRSDTPDGEFTLVAECFPCCDYECEDCDDGCYRLTAITEDGETEMSDPVCVGPAEPPTASFFGSPLTGPAPLGVTFTDESTGDILTRFWDFGDGDTLDTEGTNFSHNYLADGVYTVSLTVTGPGGSNTLTLPNYVVVSTPVPGDCGTAAYQIPGYGPTIAQAIVDLMPGANLSALPEWDGIFRDNGGTFTNSPNCYSILGREIALSITPDSQMIQSVGCDGVWLNCAGDCYACFFGQEQFTFFITDRVNITDGVDVSRFLVSSASGIVGSYGLFTAPGCDTSLGGESCYNVPGGVGNANSTIGPAIFTIATL